MSKLQAWETLALIFTGHLGRVVYTDRGFLRVLGYPDPGLVIGEPLYKALGIEYEAADQLFREVIQQGYLHEVPLEVRNTSGELLPVLFTAVASYDERGSLIGVDIALTNPSLDSPFKSLPVDHSEMLYRRVESIYNQAAEMKEQREETLLRMYFTAQISALEILLARMAGPRVLRSLGRHLQKFIQKHGWPVEVTDTGIVLREEGRMPPDALATLITEAAGFAIDVLGLSLVRQEMEAIEYQMSEEVVALARQYHLSGLFD